MARMDLVLIEAALDAGRIERRMEDGSLELVCRTGLTRQKKDAYQILFHIPIKAGSFKGFITQDSDIGPALMRDECLECDGRKFISPFTSDRGDDDLVPCWRCGGKGFATREPLYRVRE